MALIYTAVDSVKSLRNGSMERSFMRTYPGESWIKGGYVRIYHHSLFKRCHVSIAHFSLSDLWSISERNMPRFKISWYCRILDSTTYQLSAFIHSDQSCESSIARVGGWASAVRRLVPWSVPTHHRCKLHLIYEEAITFICFLSLSHSHFGLSITLLARRKACYAKFLL